MTGKRSAAERQEVAPSRALAALAAEARAQGARERGMGDLDAVREAVRKAL